MGNIGCQYASYRLTDALSAIYRVKSIRNWSFKGTVRPDKNKLKVVPLHTVNPRKAFLG
jgi:hypothetical protein